MFSFLFLFFQEKGKEIIQDTEVSQTLKNTSLCVSNGKLHIRKLWTTAGTIKRYTVFYLTPLKIRLISSLESIVYSSVSHRLCTAMFRTMDSISNNHLLTGWSCHALLKFCLVYKMKISLITYLDTPNARVLTLKSRGLFYSYAKVLIIQ